MSLDDDVLVLVGCKAALRQVSGEVGVHVLGAESRRGPESAETVQAPRPVPDLLLKFPLRGLVRVFAGIYPARRCLQQVFAYRVPVLAYEATPCPTDRWAARPPRRRARPPRESSAYRWLARPRRRAVGPPARRTRHGGQPRVRAVLLRTRGHCSSCVVRWLTPKRCVKVE